MRDASTFRSERFVTYGGSSCPICRSEASPAIDLRAFQLFRCDGCGTWASDAASRGAQVSFEPTNYFSNPKVDRKRWNDLFQRLPSRPTSVLDLGCGPGFFLEYVRERFPQANLVGADLGEEAVEKARGLLPGVKVSRLDVCRDLQSLEGPFDLITLWDVFEHLKDPAKVLEEAAGLLAPDGRLVVQTINEYSALPRLGRLLYSMSGGRLHGPARRTHEPHHLVFFNPATVGRLAEAAGLSVEEIWYDHLVFARTDGALAVRIAGSLLMSAERMLGNGLFLTMLLRKAT